MSFYVCLYTKGSIINPLSVASNKRAKTRHGGKNMKYETKTKEEIGYEELMDEMEMVE